MFDHIFVKRCRSEFEHSPTSFSPTMYWAFMFTLPSGWSGWNEEEPIGMGQWDTKRILLGMVGGGLGGIMGYNTNLSDVGRFLFNILYSMKHFVAQQPLVRNMTADLF